MMVALLLLSNSLPFPRRPRFHSPLNPPIPPSSSSSSSSSSQHFCHHRRRRHLRLAFSQRPPQWGDAADERQRGDAYVVLTACAVGLFTGLAVVLFNYTVHELRDLVWDGFPLRGASWLRKQPINQIYQRLLLVPASGGLVVGILNTLRTSLVKNSKEEEEDTVPNAVLKALAASITLGTGNSLGPEGPSVEIGSQIARGFGRLLRWSDGKRLSLVAAGSAAGISSGFNAAVGGCFFAVESVLWPSSATDSSSSLSNSTPVVILSSVIASVVSEVGLGTDPAFIVPQYDFRSPTELPLYLLLGILCGLVSVALSYFTSLSIEAAERLHQSTALPKAIIFPVLGGLSVGIMALKYPEVLYWGFENVDVLLESRPFTEPLSAAVLIQLVGVKIVATSLCRASGLVGGYYAPSLFIGAATGMAYGRFIGTLFGDPGGALFHIPLLEVASPQAYGLVGMAATLAGVCQVPLTSVLLLFELTQDYRIVLPLLGAVGISSWISTFRQKRYPDKNNRKQISDSTAKYVNRSQIGDKNSSDDSEAQSVINVSEVMKSRHELIVSMETPVEEVLNVMIQEKQPFVAITNNEYSLIGLLTLDEILEFIAVARKGIEYSSELFVYDICKIGDGNICRVRQYATPDMCISEAQSIMNMNRVECLPVVASNENLTLVGIIDRESISIALRACKAKEFLRSSTAERAPKT